MKDGTRAILTLLVILMYAAGIILFLFNLGYNGLGDDAYFSRIKIFIILMIGATILGGIVKASDNKGDSDS